MKLLKHSRFNQIRNRTQLKNFCLSEEPLFSYMTGGVSRLRRFGFIDLNVTYRTEQNTFSGYACTIIIIGNESHVLVLLNSSIEDEDVEDLLLDIEVYLAGTFKDFADGPAAYDIASSIKSMRLDLESELAGYRSLEEDLIARREKLLSKSNRIKEIQKLMIKGYKIENEEILYEFKDVVASDVRGDEEDIYLGNVGVAVNINNCKVRFNRIEGSIIRRSSYNPRSIHPHHIEGDTACLGSLGVDLYEAISKNKFDLIEPMLYNYVHSYNTDDVAGASGWVLWGGGKSIDDYIYHERDEVHYLRSELVYSKHDDSYYRRDETVFVSDLNDNVYIGYTHWSEELSKYFLRRDVVFIPSRGDYLPRDHENVLEINGEYFHRSRVTKFLCGNEYPIDLGIYIEKLDGYAHKNEVFREVTTGDWYWAEDPEIVKIGESCYLKSALNEYEGEYILPSETVITTGGKRIPRSKAVEFQSKYYLKEEFIEKFGL